MLGEPVYETDCQDDEKEDSEKTVKMLNQMEIKFKERFTEATEKVNTYLHMYEYLGGFYLMYRLIIMKLS